MDDAFPHWLRIEIERLYPSQAEFARTIGVAPQVVNNWVQGKNRPELENIAGIARALGKSPHEIAERAGIQIPGARPEPRSLDDIAAAGIPAGQHFHDARHFAASLLIALGVPTRAVMDMLGHADTTITHRYAHIWRETREHIAAQIEAAIGPATKGEF